MKKLVSNMANLASTIRIKALCLVALTILVNGAWGQTFTSDKDGDWESDLTWEGGTQPSDGSAIVIKNKVTLNSDYTAVGLTFNSGKLNIKEGCTLTAENGGNIVFSATETIIDGVDDGYGTLVLKHKIKGNSKTLTTYANVVFEKGINGGDQNFSWVVDDGPNINVNKGTFTNNRCNTDAKKPIAATLTINSEGTFVAADNTICGSITMNGGALQIADGKTVTVTNLTINANSRIVVPNDGSATLTVTNLTIDPNATLTVEGNLNWSNAITLSTGHIESASGTLTFSNIVYLSNDYSLAGSGSLIINGIIDATGNASSSHSLTTNINVTANNDVDYKNYLDLIVNSGTFTSNRNKEIKSITINAPGTFVAKNSVTPWFCTMNGGTLTIEPNKTFKVKKATDDYQTLFVDDNATITGDGTLDVTRIKIKSGKKLTINGNITLNQSVTIDGNIEIGKNGVLNINGDKNLTFCANSTIIGGGTLNFKGNSTINGLTDCAAVSVTNAGSGTVTYAATSTHIIPGTYNNLTLNANDEGETKTFCGDVTVTAKFSPSHDMTLSGGERVAGKKLKKLSVTTGTIANSHTLTTNNLNIDFGNNVAVKDISITGLNIAENDTLTIVGDATLKRSNGSGISFGGNGLIIINANANLITNQTITFNAANQIIKGGGTFAVKNQIIGNTIITYSNVDITNGSNPIVDLFVVSGGTFKNSKHNLTINNILVSGGTFEAAATTNTKVNNLTVTNGGTVKVDNGKNLIITTGNPLTIDGSGTLQGGKGSLISADNIDLQENAILTIKDTVKINHPLVVSNVATIRGEAITDTLCWNSDGVSRITVDEGQLTISGTLTVAGDVTLEGQMAVANGANLNLGGSNIKFAKTTKFPNSEGIISFIDGVTISTLTANPHLKYNNLIFGANVTYDNTCTAMFPGEYTNLTLGTDSGKNITLYDSVEVVEDLNWNNGRIVLNGNKLIVKDKFKDPATAFGENHLVVAGNGGKLVHKTSSAQTSGDYEFVAPIGTSTMTSSGALRYIYSPNTFAINTAITNIATGDTITSQVDGEALLGKSTDLRRYWTITCEKVYAGTLNFTYDDADDVLGYGSNEGKFWRVFHCDTVYNEVTPSSPFVGNVITVTLNKPVKPTDADIRGTWTACEYPAVPTLYAFADGDWDKPGTWTTSSAGSTWINPGNVTPNSAPGKYDVVILSGRVIKGTSNGIHARSVLLQTENSKLIIPAICETVEINNISGSGELVIKDKGTFPPNIKHTDLFMAPDGGTTIFETEGATVSGQTFDFSHATFNNLVIKLKGARLEFPTDGDTPHKLQINGDFDLEKGTLVYTEENQSIHVEGDVNVGSEAAIANEATVGNRTAADTLQIGGNFINKGVVSLTSRVRDLSQNYYYATHDEDVDGDSRGILRFVGERDVRFECRNTTNISQLIVDKGVDWTYRVTLEVYSNEANFGLFGRSNYTAATGFEKSKAYPAAPVELNKPLWLKSGTLELTGKTKIYSLAEQPLPKADSYDCAYIPAAGCLHLNGEEVFVQTSCCPTTTAWTDLIPAGKLLVEDGTLDGGKSSGITFVGTSFVEVKKGTVRMSQFRASEYAKDGLTTYIQSGGDVTFDGNGDIKEGLPLFFMPEASYTFQMTDGTLEVGSSMDGAFVVKSNPENGKITGGTIIINTGAAVKADKDVSKGEYLIATELPLYNLVLKNDQNNGLASGKYVKHYINDLINAKYLKNKYTVNIIASTTIQGDLTIEGNGSPTPGSQYNVIFDTQGKPVTVGGNLYIKNGAVVYTQGENEFIMNGPIDDEHECGIKVEGKVVVSGTDATEGFHNLTIADGAEVKMKSDITVRGDFRLGSRAKMKDFVSSKTYTMMGNAYIEGTYEKNNSLLCKMVLEGGNIYSTGSGVISNVEINAGPQLTLADPNTSGRQTKLTITGNLTFASNTRFNIGGNNLVFGPEASVSGEFNSNCMILTTGTSARGVTKEFAAPGSFLFPFGTQNTEGDYYYYTPAYFTFGTADSYGSITSRPIFGQAFRGENSLKCYWNTEVRGFSGVTIPQQYFWYDVPEEDFAAHSLYTDLSGWVPARRYNSEWNEFSSTFIDYELDGSNPKEHNIYINLDDANINGYYTCGLKDVAFENTEPLYSRGADGELDWYNTDSWATGSHDGSPAGVLPTATTTVYIGDATHHHTVKVNWDEDGDGVIDGEKETAECASLCIAPGSTLDLNNYTEFEAPIVEVADEAEGAGTIRISTNSFPKGDFGQFNGEYGGTVEYYIGEGAISGYTIPDESEDGSALANYRNLIVGGTAEYPIVMPNGNITVFDTLTINGVVRTNTSDDYTIDVQKDLFIVDGGQFEVYEAGNDKQLTINVARDLKVETGGKIIATGTAANTTTNKLQIGGDLFVDGTFTANSSTYTFDTEFVGENNSRIYGDSEEEIAFNILTCNKDNLDAKLTLETSNVEHSNPNKLLDLKKGTFEVAIDGEIPLTKNSNFTIPADARLLVTSGKARVGYSDNVLILTLNGHIEINGGELIVGKSKSKYTNVFYAPDGKPSITVIDGSLTVYSQISRTISSEMGSLLWEQRGGTVTIHGYGRPGTANLRTRGAFEIANNGEFKMTGGTLIVEGVGGDDQYGDIYIKPVKSECTGGTIVAAGTGTQKIHTSVSLYNLEVANGAVLNTLTDINVYGLQIDNTGRYNALGHKLTIRKWFHNENNEAASGASEGFILGAATHLTQFVGTNMEFKGINESETQFNELIINGNFSLAGEHSNIRVSGNLTQESGTVNDHGNVISLYGDLAYNGSFTGDGGINLCRTDKIQYIEGNARGTIGTLSINNPFEVHLSTDLHITKKLVLGASLYINRSRVILDHTAVVESSGGDFDSGRMIRLNGEHEDNGVIQYIQHNPKNYIIPIGVLQGSDRYYTPAIYNFTKNNLADGAASITVKTIKSRHKNLTQEPTKWLDYYWVVTTDGFGEDGSENFAIKEPEDCNFAVKQTYIYPIGKVSDGDDEMFPEYLYYGGETEFEWERLADKASLKNAVSTDNDTVIYEPFGHIYGDYTVGCVGDDIYTGRPVLYSCKSGLWDDPETWVYKNESGDMVSYKEITGAVNVEEYRINGNPFHISPGHTVTVTKDHTSAYSVTFDEGAELGILNVGQTVGSDFGRVKGAGRLVMYPVPADENYYKMPAGNFSVFLANTQSVIEFAGGNGKLPNAIIGQVSNPLQNVILSGSGEKRLTKEFGEYINGYMQIENGVSLNFGNTPIHIKGNWIDKNLTNSGFIAGSSDSRSLVEFNGSNKQQIILSNDQIAFYKLQINNPEDVEIVKSNDDGVTIETAKVTINKDLKLTNGCIIDMNNSLITIANAADISSASASKYVVGPLAKVISGNKGYTFPIGTIDEETGDKVYAPVQVNPVSKTGTYKVTFHSGSYDFGIVWPFNEMSRTEYWEIEPLDVTGATAKLELRVGDNTITGLNASMLNKVSIAGNNGTNWEKIDSKKNGGSLPSAKIITNKAVALDDYEQYTFGISASTARLIDKDLAATTRSYDVCDGDSSVTIPVFFTGSGGPYSVKLRITDQEKSKYVDREIGSLSAEDNIVLTGSDFAVMFGKSEGYSTEPYIIEIVSMKDNGEDGAPAGNNKAAVTVHYNALPVIDGIKTVGMGDERSYSIVEVEGLGIEIDYLWSVSPNKAVIDPINESTATITFGEDTEPFTVTLKAQNTYKVEVNGHYCVREGTKVVNVESKPQPLIVGNFGLCKVPDEGGTAEYSTEKVAGHTYLWKITDKAGNELTGISVNHSDVENEDYNTATVTWDETFDATEAKLTVTEAYIKDESRVSNDAERVITFYEGVALEKEDFSFRPIVCDNTVGSVKLETSDASCSYTIYDATGTTPIGPAYFGTGGELLMKTTEPLLYSSGPKVKIMVVAKNKGCEVKQDTNIAILKNPEIDKFAIDDRDSYQGKLVQLSYTPNEIGINNYSFNYSNEGVTYYKPATSFENKTLPEGRYMMVEIPKADRMKGTLTINHTYSDEEKTCSNTYNIDRAISKDYLWKGTGTAEPGEWSAGANWWMGSAPDYDKDDVVAIIRPDNLIDWETGETSTTVGMPKITTTTDAGNVKIEAGASLAIASGQKLIVHGDIENNGTLDYDGTIEFSAKTHNVTSSSSDASFKNIALVAGATVNANSNINVTGAIENNGTLGGGKKIILSGEAAQTISGSGTFTNLEVNKESGNVTAASDINIDGPLTLTKGLIKLGDNTLYFGTNGSTTEGVYTESAKSWIAGNVSKTWADDRQNEFTFPIGNGYRLAMVGIEPNSKGATFTANYSFTKGREAITENLTGSLTRVSGSEVWILTGDASSHITLHWFNADSSGITSDRIADLLVAHLKGGSWEPIAAAPKGTNAIRTTTLVADYSPFTFGTKSLDEIHPLPVTFAAFTGRQVGNSVVLEWTTLSENNNDYFEIERSTDGVNFVTIGYVDGAGNSSSRIDYIFSDNAPEQGRLYYRLSQVDFDGTREYADKVVSVIYAGSENNQLTVVPNPTNGHIRIGIPASLGDGVIELLSQTGRIVRSFSVNSIDATLDITDMSSGIYILRFVTDDRILQQKVVKY